MWPFNIPGMPGMGESNIYALPISPDNPEGYEQLGWYCWTPDASGDPQPWDGQYMVPTWDFWDIWSGGTQCRQITFYLYQPVNPASWLYSLLFEWYEYQYDILLNRTTSLKISTYFDQLAVDPEPCRPYPYPFEEPFEEIAARSSDCSVFFEYEIPEPPQIDDVFRDHLNQAIGIVFWTQMGIQYFIESSPGPYDPNYNEAAMIWNPEIVIIGTGGLMTWMDPNAPPNMGPEKYYRIYVIDPCAGGRVYCPDTVGAMSIWTGRQRNMVSSPFRPYPDGGLSGGGMMDSASLDKIVGPQLTGHPVSKWASDRIDAWDVVAQTYILAWRNTMIGQWQDWNAFAPPQFGIDSDRGYWFTILNIPTDFVFFGQVSKSDRSIPIAMQRNMVGSCFPVSCLLTSSNLWTSGFKGHPVSQWASDKIEFWNPVLQTYVGVWYRNGIGWTAWGAMVGPPPPPYDSIDPGEGWWIKTNVGPAYNWTYEVPPRSGNP